MENFFKNNFKKIILLILLLGFLVPLFALNLTTNCELNDSKLCLDKMEGLMPDFFWHFNTIKYVSSFDSLPLEVDWLQDGGENGNLLKEGNEKGVYHSPIYYYLGSFVYSSTLSLYSIHILSIVIMLITNLIFLVFLKKISKKIDKKYTFMTFSMLLFTFLPVELFASLIIHPSVLYIPFLLLSLIYFLKFQESPSLKNSILLGVLLGLGILTDLKGLVMPSALTLFLIYLLSQKKYYKFKLLFLSLAISGLIGSTLYIRNTLLFGSPIGFYKTNLGAMLPHEFSKLLTYFNAFWGGVYGGNDLIKIPLILVVLLISILTLIGIYNSNYGKNIKLGIFLIMGVITLILGFFMTCTIDILISTQKCVGDVVQGRYLAIMDLVIAIFASLALVRYSILGLILILLAIILFSVDFIWAFI